MFRIDCQIKYLDYEANNKPTFDVTLRRDSQNTKPSPQELNDFQRAQSGINYRPTLKGGAMNLKVGGGVNALEGGGSVNTVKTLTFEKGGGCMTPPPPMVAPPLPILWKF